jgi:hypothetical protein
LQKKILDILRILARELIEKGYDAEDALNKIDIYDIDFLSLKDELVTMELSQYTDEAELDAIRALLSYILMKETELDTEDIYAFTFGKGRQIIWN